MKRTFCWSCLLLAAAVGLAYWWVKQEEPELFGSKLRDGGWR